MLLEVEGIVKSYSDQVVPVLDGIRLSVASGERVGIIGPSGSGKTTFARIVAGLEPADSGSIEFEGTRVDFDKGDRVRRGFRSRSFRAAWLGMQMVFQNPAASFSDRMDIGDAVWEGAAYNSRFSGCSRREREEMVVDVLERVGLDGSFVGKRAFELSGGECQRAAIARAIIGEPRLLICDEATSALDVTVQARIIDLLKRLQQENAAAFLFISHDIALVQGFCDTVYSL